MDKSGLPSHPSTHPHLKGLHDCFELSIKTFTITKERAGFRTKLHPRTLEIPTQLRGKYKKGCLLHLSRVIIFQKGFRSFWSRLVFQMEWMELPTYILDIKSAALSASDGTRQFLQLLMHNVPSTFSRFHVFCDYQHSKCSHYRRLLFSVRRLLWKVRTTLTVIQNSFIQKPCYPDRIFRNGSLAMGNALVFPEICFPDPELNFLDKTYDFLYKFPRLSGNQKTRLSHYPDLPLPTIVWTFQNDCTVTFLKRNRPICFDWDFIICENCALYNFLWLGIVMLLWLCLVIN